MAIPEAKLAVELVMYNNEVIYRTGKVFDLTEVAKKVAAGAMDALCIALDMPAGSEKKNEEDHNA